MTSAVLRFRRSFRTPFQSLVIIVLAFAGAGCLDYDEKIEARSDGSATMTFRYRLPVILLGLAKRGDPDAVVPLSFDAEEIAAILDAARLRASKLSVLDIDGERRVEVVVELDSIEDIARLPRIPGHEFRFTSDPETGDWCLGRSIALASGAASSGPLLWIALELARLRFECRLPWRVRETNADAAESGVLVWERRLADLSRAPFVMSARVVPPSILEWAASRPWVLGALASMALAGAGFAFARRRRRGGNPASPPAAA